MVLTQLGVRAAMKHPLSVYCSFGGIDFVYSVTWIFFNLSQCKTTVFFSLSLFPWAVGCCTSQSYVFLSHCIWWEPLFFFPLTAKSINTQPPYQCSAHSFSLLSFYLFVRSSSITMAASDVPCCETMFWIYLVICVALVSFAGLMSGLTLGLMSLSLVDLEVLAKAGRPQDRRNAG